MPDEKSLAIPSNETLSGPVLRMFKRNMAKSLYLMMRDRQVDESDVEELLDGIISLAAVEAVNRINATRA